MTEYNVKLNSGETIVIGDERSLDDLAAALCQDGYIQVVQFNRGGYQGPTETPLALFERAVASITQA